MPPRSAGVRSKLGSLGSISSRPIDFERARRFIASVPRGSWTSYGDVAEAAQSPRGAQAVGTWCARHGDEIPNVHRVLNAKGEVSPGWRPAGPELPANRARVKALLEDEGLEFDTQGRAAKARRWRPSDSR